MNPTRQPALLNRAVFTQRAFDSRALSVLTTLVHRFTDSGQYEVFIRRAGAVVHRTYVHVAPEHGRPQIDVDMADVPASKRACGCHGDAALELRTGGAVAFYVSSGVGGYTVTVTNRGARDEKAGLALESSRGVPAGSVFALTLVQPGTYRIETGSGSKAEIRVRLPSGEKGYRPDRVTRLTLTRRGFEPASAEIFSGQSVAILCEITDDIRAELVSEEGGPPALDRSRGSFRKDRSNER